MKNYFIGIDWGATYIKTGVLKGDEILKKNFFRSRIKDPQEFISFLLTFIKNSGIAFEHLRGIGVGCPGIVDTRRGFIWYLPNIKGWKNVPLRQILEEKMKLPVYIDNDANLMALGEARYGAGKRYNDMVCITLGTGLGAGIILNKKLFHSHFTSGAELGHMPINYKGDKCSCGGYGCIETFVGNNRIVDRAKKLFKTKPSPYIKKLTRGNMDKLTTKVLAEAAQMGCRTSKKVWDEVGMILGRYLVGLINAFGPEAIIIGGGVSKASKFFLDSVRHQIRTYAMYPQNKMVKVVKAHLNEDATILGAREAFIDFRVRD